MTEHPPLTSMYERREAAEAAQHSAIAASAELLNDLREKSLADRSADVAVPAETLLRLLDHIGELRHDLAAIDRFADDMEKEEEGYSPTVWAWNQILADLKNVPRLRDGDLEDITDPLIDRVERAETTIQNLTEFVLRQISRYKTDRTSIQATKILSILEGKSVE
ncbi:hypothetical protein [Arthrobacter koreensis]|uniref:hypothetical protein n=1 Tax=Arthrobacter koreensis TaxID=199136 RepID=UPI0038305497